MNRKSIGTIKEWERYFTPASQNTEVISFLDRNDNIEDNPDAQVENAVLDLVPFDDASRASLECKKCVVDDVHERFIIALRQCVHVHDVSIFSPREFGLLDSNYPDHDEGWRRISRRFLSFHEISTYSGTRYKGSLDSATVIISVHLKPGVGHWAVVIRRRDSSSGAVTCYYVDSLSSNVQRNSQYVRSRLRGTPILPYEYVNNWTTISVPAQVELECGTRMALHSLIGATSSFVHDNIQNVFDSFFNNNGRLGDSLGTQCREWYKKCVIDAIIYKFGTDTWEEQPPITDRLQSGLGISFSGGGYDSDSFPVRLPVKRKLFDSPTSSLSSRKGPCEDMPKSKYVRKNKRPKGHHLCCFHGCNNTSKDFRVRSIPRISGFRANFMYLPV